MSWTQMLLVGLIVFVTHAIEGITGFGCTVLAMPFIVLLLGIHVAKPVLAVLAWLLAGYIVAVSWKKIVWKEFYFIVLFVGLGLPVGMVIYKYLNEDALKGLLSLVMIAVGIHGFVKTWRSHRRNSTPGRTPEPFCPVPKNLFMRTILFLGGIVHGMFATGGPFVVIYASKAIPDKSLFRVSICLLWLTLNTVLIFGFTFIDNVWTPDMTGILLLTLPFLVAGMLFGDFLHHRVNEYAFRLIVYALLLGTGFVVMYGVVVRLICPVL